MKTVKTTAIAAALIAALSTVAANAADEPAKAADPAPVVLAPKQPLPKSVTQLTIIDSEGGDQKARAVESGSAILVHYAGWLYDASKPDGKGAMFDTSAQRATPYGFIVGAGRVIKGWDRGLIGMKPKGKRTLIIPADLAYGSTDRPKIPANSTLLFDIELIDIISSPGAAPAPKPAPTVAPVAAPAPAQEPTMLSVAAALPMLPTNLTIIERTVGTGATAVAGVPVSVHYTGWLYDAKAPNGKSSNKFDSSVDRGEPIKFPLGAGRVIKGWDQGLVGMKVGGKRTLIIPPDFGYGARGAGGVIPPNATLIFDVELMGAGADAK
jgi:peptidylprolyl isomerase